MIKPASGLGGKFQGEKYKRVTSREELEEYFFGAGGGTASSPKPPAANGKSGAASHPNPIDHSDIFSKNEKCRI